MLVNEFLCKNKSEILSKSPYGKKSVFLSTHHEMVMPEARGSFYLDEGI